MQALSELAQRQTTQPVPIGDIADRRGIPVQFLEQLFSTLRKAGILQSQRGVKGGYSFARDPRSVTVLEVVEALDGAVAVGTDGAAEVFAKAAGALREKLASSTIADVAESESQPGAQMYYI